MPVMNARDPIYAEESERMIRWLEDKSPDVWHYIAVSLNWDFAEIVLDWLVSQPNCDKATAAFIFWLMNPDEYAEAFPFKDREPEFFDLFGKILERWKSDGFTRGELKWRDDILGNAEVYRAVVAERSDRRDPFDVPEELFTSHDGREPNVPAELRTVNNADLRELFGNLGTFFH